MHKLTSRVIKTLAIFTLLLALLLPLSDWLYEQRIADIEPFPTTCLEGWAHRGYVNVKQGFVENTLASYQQAIHLGATGIELDVLYDVALNDFIVSHNRPYHIGTDGTVLLLEEAFQALPKINIWLDAKNFFSLWPWQASMAAERLDTLLEKYNRKHQVLVESRNPWYLQKLASRDIKTTLMIAPNPSNNPASMWTVIVFSKLAFSLGDFNGVSISYPRYRKAVKESFKEIPAYLSTLNNTKLLPEYLTSPKVKIFLTDNPKLYGKHCTQ